MKIYSNKQYLALVSVFTNQKEVIKAQSNYIKRLEHDIRLLKNINSQTDIIFPNTDERGLNGDSGSPTIPEIFEM